MSTETLKAATLAILADGANWTQKANARLADDKSCSPTHPDATKWDVMGALIKAQKDSIEPNYVSYHAVYADLRSKIPDTYKNTDLESYNDDVTWAEIAALFV